MIITITRSELHDVLCSVQKRLEKLKNNDEFLSKIKSLKNMIRLYENEMINNSDCKIYFKKKGSDEIVINVNARIISEITNNIGIPIYDLISNTITNDQKREITKKSRSVINRGLIIISYKYNLFSLFSNWLKKIKK